MQKGDLVIIQREFPNVPLYPGGDFEMRPFLAQPGDLAILLGVHFLETYARVLHPVAGFCVVAKRRLEAVNESR